MDQSTSLSHVKELLYLLGIILSTGMLSSYIAKILRLPDVVFLLFAGIILELIQFLIISFLSLAPATSYSMVVLVSAFKLLRKCGRHFY